MTEDEALEGVTRKRQIPSTLTKGYSSPREYFTVVWECSRAPDEFAGNSFGGFLAHAPFGTLPNLRPVCIEHTCHIGLRAGLEWLRQAHHG